MSRISNQVGDISGTRPYMAPEQWADKHQNEQTDQYALAVMFYEFISGAAPFASAFETNDPFVMMQVAKEQIPEVLPELKRKQNKFLLTALAKDPNKRFASCADFVNAVGGKKFVVLPSGGVPLLPSGRLLKLFLLILLLAIGFLFYFKGLFIANPQT